MNAIVKDFPKHWLEERRRSGACRWDEMWEGVLHIPPVSTVPHQELLGDLLVLLHQEWHEHDRLEVIHRVPVVLPCNQSRWEWDYRIPDLLILDRQTSESANPNFFSDPPPLCCIEIHSPGDESYKKLSFYFELGVPEVWIIHRDTKKPEVFLRDDSEYRLQSSENGWVRSPATDVPMKGADAKLHVRFGAEGQTYVVPK
jgi:Uma2 family endonuclease